MIASNYRQGLAPCPGCQTPLAAPLQAAGRTARCNCCGTRFSLPSAQDLFEFAIAYLLEHDEEFEGPEDTEAVTQQIQRDTMVRTAPEPVAAEADIERTEDFAWLG